MDVKIKDDSKLVLEDAPTFISRLKDAMKQVLSSPEMGIIIPLILLIAITGISNPVFFSGPNISSILRAAAFIGIICIGQTMLLISGQFDISVGSVAGLGAILATWFMTNGFGTVGGIAIALMFCSLIGLFNGLVIVKLKVPAFIATIGMLYIARGFSYIITQGYPIFPIPDLMNAIGNLRPLRTSLAFVLFLVLVIATDFLLRSTVFGRKIYATGDNADVAKLAGIDTDWVQIKNFIITAMLAGVAGILLAAQLRTGSPTIGNGWELRVIAATAIGGISLFGGIGTMYGALIGVLILAVLNNALILLGLETHWQTVAIGAVMIVAVLMDLIRRSRKVGYERYNKSDPFISETPGKK